MEITIQKHWTPNRDVNLKVRWPMGITIGKQGGPDCILSAADSVLSFFMLFLFVI